MQSVVRLAPHSRLMLLTLVVFCYIGSARKKQTQDLLATDWCDWIWLCIAACFRFVRKVSSYVHLAIIIKFLYNARSDWLKERALSEYRARPVEKWRTNFD